MTGGHGPDTCPRHPQRPSGTIQSAAGAGGGGPGRRPEEGWTPAGGAPDRWARCLAARPGLALWARRSCLRPWETAARRLPCPPSPRASLALFCWRAGWRRAGPVLAGRRGQAPLWSSVVQVGSALLLAGAVGGRPAPTPRCSPGPTASRWPWPPWVGGLPLAGCWWRFAAPSVPWRVKD